MIAFKARHFERDVVPWAVRRYVSYPNTDRPLEGMMAEHGVKIDHATLNRRVVEYVPLSKKELDARSQPIGPIRRMGKPCVKVKDTRTYLYRAVDKAGATVDFPPIARRYRKRRAAASRQDYQEKRHARADQDRQECA